MPTPYPWWFPPDSGSNLWSWSHECLQASLQKWHTWSCILPELRPEQKNYAELHLTSFCNLGLTIFHKPPATRRRCVSAWCWAEGYSGHLCKCSTPVWTHQREPSLSQQHRWCTQTWWEWLTDVSGLSSFYALGSQGSLTKPHLYQRSQVPQTEEEEILFFKKRGKFMHNLNVRVF